LPQKDFQLNKALQEAGRFAYKMPAPEMNGYKGVLREFVKGIMSNE
jgi:hypothetical protein